VSLPPSHRPSPKSPLVGGEGEPPLPEEGEGDFDASIYGASLRRRLPIFLTFDDIKKDKKEKEALAVSEESRGKHGRAESGGSSPHKDGEVESERETAKKVQKQQQLAIHEGQRVQPPERKLLFWTNRISAAISAVAKK
jgi:hypothetical protein